MVIRLTIRPAAKRISILFTADAGRSGRLSGLILLGFLSVCFECFSAKDGEETAVEEFIPEQN